jgi:phosphoglycerate dehydrogenase-like enzyme
VVLVPKLASCKPAVRHKQPLPETSELWGLPNVIDTTRIAGMTSEKWPALLPIFRDNLRAFSLENRCGT